MMQTGFLLLTVGSVRARSARSVCVKNVADAVFGGVAYYLFGVIIMWCVFEIKTHTCTINRVCFCLW